MFIRDVLGVAPRQMSTTRSSSTSAALDHGRAPAAPAYPVRRLGERLAVVEAPPQFTEAVARDFSRAVLALCADGIRELVLDLSAVRRHAWPAVYALCELEAHLSEACCAPVAVSAHSVLVQDLRAVGLDRAWGLSGSTQGALAELLRRPVG